MDRPLPKKQPRHSRAEDTLQGGGAPAANRLIVHFAGAEDPSAEQTAAIRNLIRKFARTARVASEMPGAVMVYVRPEGEAEFRRAVQGIPDWEVAGEGTAEMPPSPAFEEVENGEQAK